MGHIKQLGSCHVCGEIVQSVMDEKEHVIGDVARNGLIGWSDGKDLKAA